jgi:hypothetical protein
MWINVTKLILLHYTLDGKQDYKSYKFNAENKAEQKLSIIFHN